MKAENYAKQAAVLVNGAREKQYGDKVDNFGNIARLWSAYLRIRRDPAAPLSALDVANMNQLQKLARTQLGAHTQDNYVDAAGYASCAGEIADYLYGADDEDDPGA